MQGERWKRGKGFELSIRFLPHCVDSFASFGGTNRKCILFTHSSAFGSFCVQKVAHLIDKSPQLSELYGDFCGSIRILAETSEFNIFVDEIRQLSDCGDNCRYRSTVAEKRKQHFVSASPDPRRFYQILHISFCSIADRKSPQVSGNRLFFCWVAPLYLELKPQPSLILIDVE